MFPISTQFLASILILLLRTNSAFSLQLGNFFGGIKAPAIVDGLLTGATTPAISPIRTAKEELLSTISNTANGKNADLETQQKALQLVNYLESNAPVPANLLEDSKAAQLLDGVWYLHYTAPSDIEMEDTFTWKPENSAGDPKIDTQKVNIQGSVRAGGLTVDTSNRVTIQSISVSQQRIENQVEQDFGMVTVGGSFRPSETIKNRAIVAFEKADIELNNGVTLKLGFLFSTIALFRGGVKDNGWLETTFLDDEMRIGRGNKGSLFVLTRDKDSVQP